ncbi:MULTISPECIES: DNA integrity scanning diadenylate cyclase DisA [unclassified Halanaerobium]|uniref:DNA integrity scanning diadenylate cyclase DisA n=1 Tax=unclassified Halanaerobium TaxID=2641197 RepID=UPI000DF24F3A|nr:MULTISPECIES: DNA integrity scanning diadenylate cyclase DisA [unclassified Halanaerobium]RCW41251.1 diadenylate cyclase [Halanaerobium sp. MA284_MarDTE_T2]RCW79660.1 diadenylate cyclase [Halanaerobium sp. DL-01]
MEQYDEKLLDILKILAPGTDFREGLENILRAQTGALLIVGDSEETLSLVNDGFEINTSFTPTKLYELAKMDGAIVLDRDAEKILVANAQLIPDPTIPSTETGTRHKTAERVAKQTGELVIAISERRSIITIYKADYKHILEDIGVILTKANQAVQTLEKYRSVFDQALTNLSALEFEDLVTISDVVTVIQRTEMVLKIQREIEKYISELGTEGRLIKMQLEELVTNVKEEGILLIKDYIAEAKDDEEQPKPENLLEELTDWSSDEILTLNTISKALGYSGSVNALDQSISPRGYRILRKIPRLPMPVIENLVEHFDKLQEVIRASVDELDDVDGIGEVRAQAIKDGLRRLRDQVLLDRHI